jgi:hypothetical protein
MLLRITAYKWLCTATDSRSAHAKDCIRPWGHSPHPISPYDDATAGLPSQQLAMRPHARDIAAMGRYARDVDVLDRLLYGNV